MSRDNARQDSREVEALSLLCRQYGAVPPQDVLMARKLLERAEQLALTRGTDKLEALQYLLSLMKKAREGDTAVGSAKTEGWERSPESEKLDDQKENR